MATKHTAALENSFHHAIDLLESLRDTINRGDTDYSELKIIIERFKATMNIDFKPLIELLEIFSEQKDNKYCAEIERELDAIESSYHDTWTKIFVVDNEFIYRFPSEVVLHYLSVVEFGKSKVEHHAIKGALQEKTSFKSRVYATVNKTKINLNFFDSEILKALTSDITIEHLKPVTESEGFDGVIKILQFLLDTKQYKVGDQVYAMNSGWISKNGRTRWRQEDFSEVIQTNSGTKHYVDVVSDHEVIHRLAFGPAKSSTSVTTQFRRTTGHWNATKTLQRLIG